MNQRWNHTRNSFRPNDPIDTKQYEVAPILNDNTAKEFILKHHYSGSYPAARWRFGLYDIKGRLSGIAVFSHPVNDKTLTNVFGGEALESVELGRFVLLDEVPGNGETWFLGQCFRQLKPEGLRGVLSFSDPVPRTRPDGVVIFPGHIGTIYQAHNAIYLGKGTARTLRILPDGTVFSDRAIQKIRKQEQGWEYACEILVKYGAPRSWNEYARGGPDIKKWLDCWTGILCGKLRHSGNFRYAWALDRSVHLPAGQNYPKKAA